MIIGADVAHPGPGANRPSVASLVWSHDLHGASYCATTRVQLPRSEMITDLKEMVKMAITMFGDKHKTTPANIFFFRDGVSEGEFAEVKKNEIGAINGVYPVRGLGGMVNASADAFNELWSQRALKMAKPLLTFLVVGKRHHVSFFPTNDRYAPCLSFCRSHRSSLSFLQSRGQDGQLPCWPSRRFRARKPSVSGLLPPIARRD
jgi:eukaryotic translation initiation factor 2C